MNLTAIGDIYILHRKIHKNAEIVAVGRTKVKVQFPTNFQILVVPSFTFPY